MPKLNENYLNLKESYLFSEIAHRVNAYTAANPDKKVIRLGIGDVTLPIGSEVIAQLHEGVDALASAETFKGYGPHEGYKFLRDIFIGLFLIYFAFLDNTFIGVIRISSSDNILTLPRTGTTAISFTK